MKLSSMVLAVGVTAALIGSLAAVAADKPAAAKGKKILFYSQSFGFRHPVVARPVSGELSHAEKMLKEIAGKAGYEVAVTQDFNDLRDEKALAQYDAIVLYTTGNPMINRDALMKFVRGGKAIIGIHTATDTYHSDADYGKGWPEYVKMIGGAFKGHGRTHDPVTIKVEDTKHAATTMIEQGWKISDEIYQFRDFNRDTCHVLLSIDTEKMDDKTLEGHTMKKGTDYPVAWTRTEGKGKVFYTSLGHREDVWTNPVWQKHLLGGMGWAMGSEGDGK